MSTKQSIFIEYRQMIRRKEILGVFLPRSFHNYPANQKSIEPLLRKPIFNRISLLVNILPIVYSKVQI